MGGIKANITMTMIILLTAGMLLVTLITTTLWQRHVIGNEKEHVVTLLQTVFENKAAAKDITYSFHALLDKYDGSCGAAEIDNHLQIYNRGACDQEQQLRPLLLKVQQSGTALATFSGTTLGAFLHNSKYLLVAVPFQGKDYPAGAMAMAVPLGPVWQKIHQGYTVILVYILVNVLILTTIGFFRLTGLIIRPIERLVQLTATYDHEENFIPTLEKEGSEFRKLSSALQNMVKRIDNDRLELLSTVQSLEKANRELQETQQEMIQAEKLASIGRLSAGLAHEIGNPIGIVTGYLELLRRKDLDADARLQYIDRSAGELERINLLVRQLLDLSRPARKNLRPVNIVQLIRDLVKIFLVQKKKTDISFQYRFEPEALTVLTNEEALRQVIMNCILNALDSIHEAGKDDCGEILFAGEKYQDDEHTWTARLSITDNGAGISPENLEHVFDPFYTTKEPGKGTGLGLSVSYAIINELGGSITAASEIGQGTTIIIELPAAEEIGQEANYANHTQTNE